MNCVEEENVAIEDFAIEKKYQARRSTPSALLKDKNEDRFGDEGGSGDRVDSRVAEVLDRQLEHGAMPA